MWIAKTKSELRKHLSNCKAPIALVPTMGALHLGHCSLIDLARQRAGSSGTVITSIFVNPIQFDRPSDLEAYPRTLENDIELCREHGSDIVFVPDPSEIYATDRSITVSENQLSKHLCGESRPGHFDGVCTVVLKLFNLTQCDTAIFGEKDFQQLAIIKRMLRDLDLQVEIIPHPTVRETDGLAMSSRNCRLSPEHRKDAPRIYRALLAASKKSTASEILETARSLISESPTARIDYLSIIDAETLTPTTNLASPAILACAVFYGEIRLIDHIAI